MARHPAPRPPAGSPAYREDPDSLRALFAGEDTKDFGAARPLFRLAGQAISATVDAVRWFETEVAAGRVASRTP